MNYYLDQAGAIAINKNLKEKTGRDTPYEGQNVRAILG